jgi:GT2 family glycosyltransferase
VKLSLIVVTHYSTAVLPACVESFRSRARSAAVDTEVVVVEQSEDDREVETVGRAGVDRVITPPNRGYAAGLNAGAEAATGSVLLLANPDIEFLDDAVAALLSSLEQGFDVVGPRLVWDDAGRVLLPIPDDPAPRAELRRTVRRRWQGLWARGVSRSVAESWRVWSAHGPVEVPCLRGPLLALKRPTYDRLGPLDEGYFLFYEETDWLWRARRRGARLAVAGDAPVAHRWGHATDHTSDIGGIEARSRQRFFARNYSSPWRLLLRAVAGGAESAGVAARPVAGPEAIGETNADLWLLSIYPHFQPAIGCLGPTLPADGVAQMTGGRRWFGAAAIRTGRRWRLAESWSWGGE